MINHIKQQYQLVQSRLRVNKKYLVITALLIGCFYSIYAAIPLASPLFENDYSDVILDKNDQILRLYLNSNEQWILPSEFEDKVPYRLKKSILTFEDQYFYWHFGVNPIS